MAERLKQIWSGFEAVTTRRLSGNGVDNIDVPHRTDFAADLDAYLPEDFEPPSEAAFAALRADLAAKEKRFGRKRKPQDEKSFEANPAQSSNSDDLIKGLRATAMRTERPGLDYERYLASDAGKAAFKKHKKKRFGIF